MLFYKVEDPESQLDKCPGTTTLLYLYAGNNADKFEKLTRLVSRFMVAAYEMGRADALKPDPKACPECGSYSIRCGCD